MTDVSLADWVALLAGVTGYAEIREANNNNISTNNLEHAVTLVGS